jgi:hypothetical protein
MAEQLSLLFECDLPDPRLVIVEGEPRVLIRRAGTVEGLLVADRADLLA